MSHEAKNKDNLPPKKGYKRPCIYRYGTVEAMTKSAGNMGNSDSGSSPMHKTQ